MTDRELATIKHHVEQNSQDENQPIPEGFTITFNDENKLIKLFSGVEAYGNLADPLDVIVSRWNGKEWEDR